MFLVGLLNTLIGLGHRHLLRHHHRFLVALGRLSPNWLLSRISGGYVELIRNLPLLFQILFWYLAVLAALPNPRQSISILDSVFLSNRGLVIPKPIGDPGSGAVCVAVADCDRRGAGALRWYARKQLFDSGKADHGSGPMCWDC